MGNAKVVLPSADLDSSSKFLRRVGFCTFFSFCRVHSRLHGLKECGGVWGCVLCVRARAHSLSLCFSVSVCVSVSVSVSVSSCLMEQLAVESAPVNKAKMTAVARRTLNRMVQSSGEGAEMI